MELTKKHKLSHMHQTSLLSYTVKKSTCANSSQKRSVISEDENDLEGSKKLPNIKNLASENPDVSLEKKIPELTNMLKWRKIVAENLDLSYAILFPKKIADMILKRLENEVEYFSGDLLKVQVFGKWHQIPRKQVSYGDSGLCYAFSGNCIPAVPWTPLMLELKTAVQCATGHEFNFVLVNRYKDGEDHMGEHRDNEKELVRGAPIASLSFGQTRDFIFKHKDSRGSKATGKLDRVKLELEHGSLLKMNSPTNDFWYHSLPVRKTAKNVRVNLTFRNMLLHGKS